MFSNNSLVLLILLTVLSVMQAEQATAQTLYGSAGSLQPRENANNVDWAYNWNDSPTNNNNPFDVNVANYEYVPMIWSANVGNVDVRIDRILNLEQSHGVHVDYVLGFNEPELPTQANMTVGNAIDVWEIMTERFGETDIKLVSPAVSGAGAIRVNDPTRPDGWLTEFMEEVETRNADSDPENDLQVDVVAYHFYTVGRNAQTEANRLLDQIDDLWQRYQRPIWITEFAGTSFALDGHTTEERTAFNQAFLEILMPEFDNRSYVERVSWWQFGAFGRPYSRLVDIANGFYTPTNVGEVYLRTTLNAGQTYNFATGDIPSTYAHYLKGSHLTNTGPALFPAMRAVDVMEGTTNMTGSSDYSFEDQDDSYLHIRSGATLRKQGSNTVFLPGTPITNNGTLLIQSGTLQLEDNTEIFGQGTMLVDSNGTLATSTNTFDRLGAIELPATTLNRGLLHVKNGRTTMAEGLELLGSSEIRTDGNLVISGPTTGTGVIVSSGPGTLFMSGAGSHSSGAQVSAGSLIVANTDASATGTGSVLADGTGRLGGFGQVDGNVFVTGDATMAPGVSQSASGSTTMPPSINEGVVLNAIDFDFAGVQDDAPLTQTSTLSEALQVLSGLDFGPGLNPRNAANAGNEFNVAGFTTLLSFDAANAANDYLTFTVAPVEGLAIQLQDATFEVRRNGDGAPRQFRMFNSITGFDSFANGRFFFTNDTSTTTFTANFTNTAPTADPVEIRLYGWSANSGTGNLRVTNVSLDASFVSDPNSIAFDPTGIIELGGSYTQAGFATLQIDLGGTQPGDFDQLQIDGTAVLSGSLDVSLIDGFDGANGQTFDIITASSVLGTFNDVIAPEGMNVQVNYSPTGVSIQVNDDLTLLGDINRDGAVNFLDISPFISLLGLGGFQDEADLNGDGLVNFLDITPFIAALSGQ